MNGTVRLPAPLLRHPMFDSCTASRTATTFKPFSVDWIRVTPFCSARRLPGPIWSAGARSPSGWRSACSWSGCSRSPAFYLRGLLLAQVVPHLAVMQFVMGVFGNTTASAADLVASHTLATACRRAPPALPGAVRPVLANGCSCRAAISRRASTGEGSLVYPECASRALRHAGAGPGGRRCSAREILKHFAPGLHTPDWQLLSGAHLDVFLLHSAVRSTRSRTSSDAAVTRHRQQPQFVPAVALTSRGLHNNHHFYQASVRQGITGGRSISPCTCW